VRLNSAANVIIIVFFWLVSCLTLGLLTHNTKFDWLMNVFYILSLILFLELSVFEKSQPKGAVAEPEPTFGRIAIIFLAIAIWLGGMLGFMTMLPNRQSIIFPVWILWSLILILFVRRLEQSWSKRGLQ
jgi:hypothetical protein